MQPQMDPSWLEAVGDELESSEMQELRTFLTAEVAAGRGFYPPAPLVFNALRLTPVDDVRVVILGQDPYHGPGQAMGLSFSVPAGVAQPPSLRNIFTELQSDLDLQPPATGDLTAWAEQGVLLLNCRSDSGPTLPGLSRGQGLGRLHEPRHRRALGAPRRDRLSPLGTLRPAERGDRRRDAPPRSHRCPPFAVLGEQRVLRVPPFLSGQRAARGGRQPTGRLAARQGLS